MNYVDRLADEYAAQYTTSKYKGHKELAVRLEGKNVYGASVLYTSTGSTSAARGNSESSTGGVQSAPGAHNWEDTCTSYIPV